MNLNVNNTTHLFTSGLPISTTKTVSIPNPPKAAAAVTSATIINSKFNKNSEFRYVPVIMNNNVISASSGTPLHQSQNQHYPTAGITTTGATISITAAANVNRVMPATLATADGSLLHILPMQPMPMNGDGTGINFISGSTAYVNTGNNNVSNSSVNSNTSLLAPVALIAATPPGTTGGLTIQTTSPTPTHSASSINTINTTTLTGHANTLVNVPTTPINVILAPSEANNTASGNNSIARSAPGAGPTVVQQQNSPGVAASILIRNQPQYANVAATQRGAAVLPLLNQELVKQIVVGNAPKFASTTPLLATTPSSHTLLKSQPTVRQISNIVQQPKKQQLQQSATGKGLNNTKMQQIATAQKTKIPLAEAAKAVVAASLEASTISNSSIHSIRDTINTSSVIVSTNDELLKYRRQTMPSTSSQSLISNITTCKSDNTTDNNTIEVIMENKNFNTKSNLPSPNALLQKKQPAADALDTYISNSASNPVTVDVEIPKKPQPKPEPQIKSAKVTEKQESLLKARPPHRVTAISTSPRSKRSRSLNCTLKDDSIQHPAATNTGERRHSTASESKLKTNKINPSSDNGHVKQNPEKQLEIIDLIDYDEDSSDKVITKNTNAELQIKTDKTIEIILEDEEEVGTKSTGKTDEKENKTPPPTSDSEVSSTTSGKLLNVEVKTEMEMQKKDIEIENDNTITQIKVESITVEDDDVNAVVEEDVGLSVLVDPRKDIKIAEPAVESIKELRNSPETSEELLEKSLYCDEKISVSSTSSGSTTCSRTSLQEDVVIVSPIKETASADSTLTASLAAVTSTCSLKMISTFNMLTWNHRIGTARGTKMRFQLNEFNLLEINEHCPPRNRIHTAFEKPIYERESVPNMSEKQDGHLYFCRRCNCHGPAADFLAPEFCSLECLNRNSRKRRREEVVTVARKHPRKDTVPPPIILTTTKKTFRWSTYLPEKYNAIAAPVNLFLNPFPTGPNRFQIGMKLEAIDPENCALFCVCTIVDIQGYRLKLTFDGYEYMYDFWVNADSMDIFPPGWCTKTKRVLQPPKGKTPDDFSWSAYLTECKAVPAHRILFTHLNASSIPTQNPFKVGMHLEAEDLNDTGKLCVASVADVLDNRIRVHFDGWDDCYDYWVDISSPYIHPCGWHVGRQQLIVPPDFENTTFNWRDYINNHGSGMAATEEMFAARDPIDFKPNMKLEVVDPRNPSLIRPATVVGRKGHRIKLHLDCWAMDYCFWLEDDSADLHPIGWCDATRHELEPPPGYKMRACKIMCPTFGCRGIGNAKRLYLNTHATRDCCPYAPENWRQKGEKPPRLEHDEIIRIANAKQQQQLQSVVAQQRQLNEKQILERIQLLDNIKTRHVLQQEKQQGAVNDYNGDYEQLLVIRDELKTDTNAESEPQIDLNTGGNSTNSDLIQSLEHKLEIAKEFLCDYGPRLQQNFSIWQRNSAFDDSTIKRNPLLWTTKEACCFVECILKNKTATVAFQREDIDGIALLLLQQTDLTDTLELKLGPAVKLYSSILQLRTLVVTKFDVKLEECVTITRK